MANRFIGFSALTAKVALKELENLTTQLFLSKELKTQQNLKTQEQIAEIIFSRLSHMRGTGLKLLQVLSLDQDLLPKPLMRKFESAYGQVPPLARPVVKRVFKTEFKQTPEDLFASFNYDAFAAASLGQVHHARLKSGEAVVVKIQYPNVAENMATDLSFVRALAQVVGNPLMKNSIEELATHLLAEADYRQEADNLSLFDEIARAGKVQIPTVFREFSTSRILTLSQVQGLPLHQLESVEQKNLALQRIFNFFFTSLSHNGCIHADPHPGNFLIDGSQLGIVDFGAVKKALSADVVALFRLLLDADADRLQIVELYKKLGASPATDFMTFYREHVEEYHQLCVKLIGHEEIDFASQKPTISALRKTLFFQSRSDELQGLSADFTLLHKTFQSMLLMLAKYEAKIQTTIGRSGY